MFFIVSKKKIELKNAKLIYFCSGRSVAPSTSEVYLCVIRWDVDICLQDISDPWSEWCVRFDSKIWSEWLIFITTRCWYEYENRVLCFLQRKHLNDYLLPYNQVDPFLGISDDNQVYAKMHMDLREYGSAADNQLAMSTLSELRSKISEYDQTIKNVLVRNLTNFIEVLHLIQGPFFLLITICVWALTFWFSFF